MNAIDSLKNDHRRAIAIFEEYGRVGAHSFLTKRRLVEELITLLGSHTAVEERTLYPAVRRATRIEADADVVLDEHDAIKELLSELATMSADTDGFDGTVAALRERVEKHVRTEEEGLLRTLPDQLDDEELLQLSEDMERCRSTLPRDWRSFLELPGD
jgi:DUF438 domain-containing protein